LSPVFAETWDKTVTETRCIQLFKVVSSFKNCVLLMYYFQHFMYTWMCFKNLCGDVK